MSNNDNRMFAKSIKKNKSIRNTVIIGMIKNGNLLDAYMLMQIDKPIKTKWEIIDELSNDISKTNDLVVIMPKYVKPSKEELEGFNFKK